MSSVRPDYALIPHIPFVFYLLGWVGFFCTVWLATKKSMGLAKRSLSVTGSALSAYSSARNARREDAVDKGSD